MSFVKKIQNDVFREKLFERNSKIVIGVSGGPDSVCLLNLLFELKEKYELDLAVAHVNHGLRGKDSDSDEKFVAELAKRYDLPFVLKKVKTAPKANIENGLRDIRYEFFEEARKVNGFDAIAVAHNMDDQVETFLMRLIRGSGLLGLRAMQFKNGNIIRPLLGTSRKEIIEYLKSNKLEFRTDKTNSETVFLRNKIRNRLIPYLEKNFNPGIKKTVFDATRSISQDYELISELSKGYSKKKNIGVKELLSLPDAIQKMALRDIILEKKKDLKNIEESHIREILKALKSTKGKNQTIRFKGLKIERKGDKITLE